MALIANHCDFWRVLGGSSNTSLPCSKASSLSFKRLDWVKMHSHHKSFIITMFDENFRRGGGAVPPSSPDSPRLLHNLSCTTGMLFLIYHI